MLAVIAIMAMVLGGCTAQAVSGQTGTVEVRVTDAPAKEDVTGVNVTVTSVEIHQAGLAEGDESGWIPMTLSVETTFDLLKIKGLEGVLATGELAAARYTQIRMEVSKVEVSFKDGKAETAELPGGKIRFVQPFTVAAGQTTVLLFDFDAAQSVDIAGNGKVMFKPVIKLSVPREPGAKPSPTPAPTVSPTPAATSSPTPTSTIATTSAKPGKVEVMVTDAPANKEVTGVLVTVTSVEIHKAGAAENDESGWMPLGLSGEATFDLLKVKNLESLLATGELAPAKYTQIRMEVSEVNVSFDGGETETAKLPSGKLKFIQPFTVSSGQTTVLLFDFDAAQCVNITGNGQVMFKPVIKLSVTKSSDGGDETGITIATATLANGIIGTVYNATLAATGGTGPYTWSIVTGTLPAGLTLNAAAGVITGTPVTASASIFTVRVEDSATVKKSATRTFTVAIAAATVLNITTTTLADGVQGTVYTATMAATGGVGAKTWSITAGALPAGLSLNSTTGVLSGTPTVNGDFAFTVMVTDAATPTANTDSQALTLHIAA